jgi:hypothetical protein
MGWFRSYVGKQEPDVHRAFESAWDVAKAKGNTRTTLKVKKILVHGHNPITGYTVVLGPGP